MSLAVSVTLVIAMLRFALEVPLLAGAWLVVTVAGWLFLPRALVDGDICARCGHTMLDHHGNCQECLRSRVRGDASAPAVPCAKFRREPAARRTPWITVRRTWRERHRV